MGIWGKVGGAGLGFTEANAVTADGRSMRNTLMVAPARIVPVSGATRSPGRT